MSDRGVGNRQLLQAYLNDCLTRIAHGLVGFPKQTLVVRDPKNPERWSITTNEPDDVVDRVLAAFGIDSTAPGTTDTQPPTTEG